MNKTMFVCKICGAEYTACPACKERHSWRAVADTPKCWQIYMTITQHRQGIITDEVAVSDMNNIGITASTLPSYEMLPENREYLEKLFARGSEKKKSKVRSATYTVENDTVLAEDNDNVEPPVVESTEES